MERENNMEISKLSGDVRRVMTSRNDLDDRIKKAKDVHVLLIDCQNDFVTGSLRVDGAEQDMKNTAAFLRKYSTYISDIHLTLDSHTIFDIAHPKFWRDAQGNHPLPFTTITLSDVENKRWQPVASKCYRRVKAYVKELEKRGRYQLTVWPEHCLIGSWGHCIQDDVLQAVHEWEGSPAKAHYVTKGVNPWTEHYSAVMAEFPDPEDPKTQLNAEFLEMLESADLVIVAGEASSHCVLSTVQDIMDKLGSTDFSKKLVLLLDCMSPVPGFEQNAENFFINAQKNGVALSVSDASIVSAIPSPPPLTNILATPSTLA